MKGVVKSERDGYLPINPDYEPMSKILGSNLTIQGAKIGYFFGELQVYETINCYGEIQILQGNELIQYLSGTYNNLSIYGMVEISDETIIDGTLEII